MHGAALQYKQYFLLSKEGAGPLTKGAKTRGGQESDSEEEEQLAKSIQLILH